MTNEKDSIRKILEGRGVISNGVFDELRFRKLVTEPWIHTKTIKYGFDKLNGIHVVKEQQEPTIEEVVEIQEPITVVEEPVAEEVVETSTESVLLEEDLKEENEEAAIEEAIVEEPVVAEEVPTEEPVVDECPLYEAAPVVEAVEEPTVEVAEEVVETSKKKTTKKK
jgi:hypothetical protein